MAGGPIYLGGRPFFKGGLRTKLRVIASGAATVTITKSQSNAILLMDVASTGLAYTLPVPVVGLVYTFIYSVAQTGGSNSVTTDASTTFMLGSVFTFSGEKVTPALNVGPYQLNANGTSHKTFTTNGTTQGGGAGSWIQLVALSTTQWYVWGYVNSPSGTIVTPFS